MKWQEAHREADLPSSSTSSTQLVLLEKPPTELQAQLIFPFCASWLLHFHSSTPLFIRGLFCPALSKLPGQATFQPLWNLAAVETGHGALAWFVFNPATPLLSTLK